MELIPLLSFCSHVNTTKGSRYTDEFKQEANQVVQHSYLVNDAAARLGISGKHCTTGFLNHLQNVNRTKLRA